MKGQSLSDLKTEANQKMNPLQRVLKALSDVFIDIMPGILAAALLTGISGVLGNLSIVESNQTLFGINRLINISSGAIFGFLPLVVAYSACKRFGGRPIMGLVLGCIMLFGSLADAYAAAQWQSGSRSKLTGKGTLARTGTTNYNNSIHICIRILSTNPKFA